MEALEAVLDLAKERDELAHEIETYESWFESLVGRKVTLNFKEKKHIRFVEGTICEFNEGEGWSVEDDDGEIYVLSFDDFFNGKAVVA